jgi:hypothetical protein
MIVGLSRTVTVLGTLRNLGTLTLNGGVLAGAGGTMRNDFGAQMNASGTINSNFLNSGNLRVTGILTVSGGVNQGAVVIDATHSLRVSSGTFSNSGIIILDSGSIMAGTTGNLTNEAAGQIRGGGGITLSTTNRGLIFANADQLTVILDGGNVAGGELRIADEATLAIGGSPAVNSSGSIVLQGINAALTGGILENSGTISGIGRITNRLNNSGVIRPEGGTLTISGLLATNTSTGSIQLPAGAAVFYTQGLGNNGGTISLSGGTFDNNAKAIHNTGNIDGRGIFRSGGLTNSNRIAIADGPAEFFGNVINNDLITITNSTATFFNNFTNGATGSIKTTSAVARFLGVFTNNGSFISDPSDNFFDNLSVGSSGILVGGWGDRFFVSGDLISASTAADRWDTQLAELILQGAGVHDVSVNGDDLGITFDGYDNNFAWGKLLLGAGNRLALQDGDAEPGGAIYVRELILGGGLSQISSIESNGLSIYYDLGDPANAYLGGATYALSGGGQIAAVPEPVSATVSLIGLIGLLRRTRRVREEGQ